MITPHLKQSDQLYRLFGQIVRLFQLLRLQPHGKHTLQHRIQKLITGKQKLLISLIGFLHLSSARIKKGLFPLPFGILGGKTGQTLLRPVILFLLYVIRVEALRRSRPHVLLAAAGQSPENRKEKVLMAFGLKSGKPISHQLN